MAINEHSIGKTSSEYIISTGNYYSPKHYVELKWNMVAEDKQIKTSLQLPCVP